MLGWLRTAGLTASVGGQECVSDGCFIGRSPPNPPGFTQTTGFPERMSSVIGWWERVVITFRLESDRACRAGVRIEEARPTPDHSHRRRND